MTLTGQHHLLSSMILHLRYPNAHTHWFSSLILYLFLEVNDERFREVITKVLLERFIVHRPHPWGALVTFIELLRNPKYDFWNKKFIRIGPEVTLLLESVSTFLLHPSGHMLTWSTSRWHGLFSSRSFVVVILAIFAHICHSYLGLSHLHTVLYNNSVLSS